MSSYRTPYQRRNVWPDREAEKREAARKAEEEQRRKTEMNETNFPTLSTAHPMNRREALNGNNYAQLAERWAVDDEVDRRVEEIRRFREAADEFVIHRRRQAQRQEEAQEFEEPEVDEAPPAPRVTNAMLATNPTDDEGWTTVKNKKSRKPKRELTVEEMDERERQREQEENNTEFNAHLFESNRHDHDRV